MAMYGGQQRMDVRNHIINFHGRQINVMGNNGYNNGNFEDSSLAVDMLVHLKAPDTAEKLKAFLADFAHQPLDNNNQNYYRFQMLLPNYGGAGQNFQRLIDAFQPKEIVGVYMRFITVQNINDGNNGEQDIGGKKYHYGTKVEMLYRVCKFSQQDPESYNLKHISQFGDRWVIEGTQKDEDAAATRIKSKPGGKRTRPSSTRSRWAISRRRRRRVSRLIAYNHRNVGSGQLLMTKRGAQGWRRRAGEFML